MLLAVADKCRLPESIGKARKRQYSQQATIQSIDGMHKLRGSTGHGT
jgi:hypothetical protein